MYLWPDIDRKQYPGRPDSAKQRGFREQAVPGHTHAALSCKLFDGHLQCKALEFICLLEFDVHTTNNVTEHEKDTARNQITFLARVSNAERRTLLVF